MYHTTSKKRFLKPICQLFVAKSGQRDSKILSPIFAPFKRGKESISSCRPNLVRTPTNEVDIAEELVIDRVPGQAVSSCLASSLILKLDGGAHAVAPSLQGGLGIIARLLGTAGNPNKEEHGNNRHLHRIIERPYRDFTTFTLMNILNSQISTDSIISWIFNEVPFQTKRLIYTLHNPETTWGYNCFPMTQFCTMHVAKRGPSNFISS